MPLTRHYHRRGAYQARGNFNRAQRFFVFLLFLCSLQFAPTASADVISDIGGIVFDPFKLGHASDNILQSVIQINAMLHELEGLEGRTNQDLKERIADVQKIVDGVIDSVDRNVKTIKDVIANAETQINQLEERIVHDAEELLNKAQCTVKAVLDQDIENSVSKILNQLRSADPAFTLFGIPIAEITVKQIKVEDPFDAYRQTRDALLVEFRKIKPSDPAFKISQIFGDIATLAHFARCEDTANTKPAVDAILLRDEIKYKRLQKPWTSILAPRS